MSFSNNMKSDLCRITTERSCCRISELGAMIRVNGTSITEKSGEKIFKLTTENVNVAKRMYSLIRYCFDLQPRIVIRKSKKLKEHNIFLLTIYKSTFKNNVFNDVINFNSDFKLSNYNKTLLKTTCCKKAFLRGIFLAVGSITNPNNCYHLELVIKEHNLANYIKEILNKFNLNGKITTRKNNYLIYIKEVDQISIFLNIIGAHKALLDLENIRILKEMRNSVNRIVNCETANLIKIVDASVRHINNIKYLKEINELDKLPRPLYELARLRLEHPDSSLKELGTMLDPPVGKSGVNHRFNKIDEIVDEFHGNREEHIDDRKKY